MQNLSCSAARLLLFFVAHAIHATARMRVHCMELWRRSLLQHDACLAQPAGDNRAVFTAPSCLHQLAAGHVHITADPMHEPTGRWGPAFSICQLQRCCTLLRTAQLYNLACSASCDAEVEGQYLADVAKRRWPVLVFVFSFDVGCYLLRLGAKLLSGHQGVTSVGLIHNLSPQLANMAFCYLFLTYVNRRSRRLGNKAARQVLACACKLLDRLALT